MNSDYYDHELGYDMTSYTRINMTETVRITLHFLYLCESSWPSLGRQEGESVVRTLSAQLCARKRVTILTVWLINFSESLHFMRYCWPTFGSLCQQLTNCSGVHQDVQVFIKTCSGRGPLNIDKRIPTPSGNRIVNNCLENRVYIVILNGPSTSLKRHYARCVSERKPNAATFPIHVYVALCTFIW
jgi:hypothetical protein